MENKTTKCIIMSRVSTTMQELDIQEEECINMALADGYSKENIILIPRIGESARKVGEIISVETPKGTIQIELDRDGIWDMKKHIANDPNIDCVYIWEVSRLARRMDVLTPLLKYFADKQVQLRVKTNGISYLNPDKTVNPASKMTIEILGEVAEQEMNVKIERFKRSKKAMAEQGRYAGGFIPYGYKIDREHGSVYVIDENEAAVVKEIYNLYETGISQPNIAREFYRRGMPEINLSKVNNIITNEFYTGCWHKNGFSSYDRAYPAIISKSQFDRCREIAATNNTFANKSRNIYYAHGLIKCACGRTWGAGPSKVFYRCFDAYRAIHEDDYVLHPQCTNRISISINIIDSLLWRLAKEAEEDFILRSAVEGKQANEKKIALLNQKLGYIDTRLTEQDNKRKRIVDTYLEGLIEKSERDKRLKDVDETRRTILLEQAEYINDIEHLQSFISDIDNRYHLSDTASVVDDLDMILSLRKSIAGISNDQERYRIVHRYIKHLTIENREVEYAFSIVGTKTTRSRFITVYFYNGKTRYFHYLPYCGGEVVILESTPDGTPLHKLKSFEYLERFVNVAKKERRAVAKQKANEQYEAKYPSDKYISSFDRYAQYLGLKIKTVYKLVNDGYLAPTKIRPDKKHAIFDIGMCLELTKLEAKTTSKQAKWAKAILDNLGITNTD